MTNHSTMAFIPLMKNLVNKTALFLAAIAIIFIPQNVHAIGQITDPIKITDAMRGQSYVETITIVNSNKQTSQINLSAIEDIGKWVKFYENSKSQNEISFISVPAQSKKDVIAKISIPESTPNGNYAGHIRVATEPIDFKNSESGNSVAQGVDREVKIEVSDKENLIFNISVIPESYDISKGEPLKVRIIYDNQGNVDIAPQIDFRIKNGDKTVYDTIYPYPSNQTKVNPKSIFEIPALEIPTSALDTGKYKAYLTFSDGDKYSKDQDFNFSIGTVKSDNTVNNKNNITVSYTSPETSWPVVGLMIVFAVIISLISIFIYNSMRRKNKL